MRGARLLDLYVLRRFALALVLSMAGLVLIAIVVDLTENIDTFIDFRASPGQIALYYTYHTPYWIILTLPIGGLLGTLFSLSGLARRNEIAAMKALGISLYRILLPVFLGAAAVSAAAFVFGDRVVPAATYQYNQIRDRITSFNRPDGSRRQVLLQDVDGQLLFARVYDAGRQQAREVAYEHRQHGILRERRNAATLTWRHGGWWLHEGTTYQPASPVPDNDDTAAAAAPTLTVTPFDSLELTALTLSPADLAEESKKPEEMNFGELRRYVRRARANGEDVTRHVVDLHLKIAFPLTFLVIVALGAPLGANARRAGMANSFGLGIGVCFVYYSCVKAGQALGWNQVISPWAGAWAANIGFTALGVLLLWRAHK